MRTTIIVVLAAIFIIAGCTQNQMARNFGGSTTITLPECTKFTGATWKNDDLWYTYRLLRAGERPETTKFKEDASYGMMNGVVTFIESCEK